MPLTRLNDGYRPDLDGIYFGMNDGNKNVTCCVKYSALGDLVRGAPSQDKFIRIFVENRITIDAIAATKYDAGFVQDDGTIIVTTRDLNPNNLMASIHRW